MLNVFTDEVNAYIEANKNDVAMAEFITPLNEAVHDLTELTADLLTKSQANINELGASANDYLHVFGYTAMAYIWARMAQVSLAQKDVKEENRGDSGDDFYQSKLHTARYYFTRLLPRRLSLIASAKSGCDCLFDIDDELF